MPYVTDTHPLVWYMLNKNHPNLSAKAKRIFREVDCGEESISIPCIIFFELLYLIEKKRIPVEFGLFLEMISWAENYKIEPLCLPIIEKARGIPKEKVADPWDRVIAATSIYLGCPLITRDKSLEKIGLRVIW